MTIDEFFFLFRQACIEESDKDFMAFTRKFFKENGYI